MVARKTILTIFFIHKLSRVRNIAKYFLLGLENPSPSILAIVGHFRPSPF